MSADPENLLAILVADVVGYSRLAAADEDRTLSRPGAAHRSERSRDRRASRAHRQPHRRRCSFIEFRSVVDAVRSAIEVQNGLIECNAGSTSPLDAPFFPLDAYPSPGRNGCDHGRAGAWLRSLGPGSI